MFKTFTSYMYAGLRGVGKALHIPAMQNAGTQVVAQRGTASRTTDSGGAVTWLVIIGLLTLGTWFVFKRETRTTVKYSRR